MSVTRIAKDVKSSSLNREHPGLEAGGAHAKRHGVGVDVVKGVGFLFWGFGDCGHFSYKAADFAPKCIKPEALNVKIFRPRRLTRALRGFVCLNHELPRSAYQERSLGFRV